ncbi:MAG: TIGR00341 family protein, partial [Anaerolineae bacterium]|nr:TIGR00341 family protein [Anaerolineae bacterium]
VVRSTFAGLEGADRVDVRVVHNTKPIATILVDEASEGYDLVMLGASNEGMLDNILFGNVPERVAAEAPIPTIMVRAAQPAREAFLRLLWGRVQEYAPVLNREDQILLFRNLRRGARANVNYFVLIVLSAIIATLGLWQNSAAVIIGAMLVAPLMTPILATSLGVVMGEPRTIRVAAESTLKGVVLGIAIALFIALILPGEKIGSEILARTQPSLLDMAVALASGAAGAYALARKEVSAALPGVAIAAALMPPLCTVGIGLAIFSGPIAGGAFLLFTTNLIAIIVAGTAVFLVLGVRPRDDEEREQNFRRGLIVGIVMLLVVSMALALPTLRQRLNLGQPTSVSGIMTGLAKAEGVEVITVDTTQVEGVTRVVARISAPAGQINSKIVDAWSRELAARQGSPVDLTVEIVPLIEIQSSSQ